MCVIARNTDKTLNSNSFITISRPISFKYKPNKLVRYFIICTAKIVKKKNNNKLLVNVRVQNICK